MSFLPIEVEADIEVHITKEIIGGKLILAIVIAMQDATDTCEPFRIVPHNTEAACSVENDIFEREVTQNGQLIFSKVARGMFIANSHR